MKILLKVRRTINSHNKTNAWEFYASAKIIDDQINQHKIDKSSMIFMFLSVCLFPCMSTSLCCLSASVTMRSLRYYSVFGSLLSTC